MDLVLAIILSFVGMIVVSIGYAIENKTIQNILVWVGCVTTGIGSIGLFIQ